MTMTPRGSDPPPTRGLRSSALLTQLGFAWFDPGARARLIGGGIASVLIGLIFWRNLFHFGLSWATDENYSHGFLVPFISLYFAEQAAQKGTFRLKGGATLGMVLLATALLIKLPTAVVAFGTLGDLALIVAIAGVCALLAGTEALKRYGFAIGFLVFMIPMPVALYAMIASPLQLMVSKVASAIMNATGVPVLTEGNMMTLPGGVQMFVAEACSGMRQLTGFLALTAAVAHLSSRPVWWKTAVVLSAVPVAMAANVARVTLTGYIMYYVNPAYASGTFHTVEGLLMLGFGLALLRAFGAVLDLVADAFGLFTPASPPAESQPARVLASSLAKVERRSEELVNAGRGGDA